MDVTSPPEIVLVGNGTSAILTQAGSLIDSAKTVVRFNGFSTDGHEEHTGSKTDVWALNYNHKKTAPVVTERGALGFDFDGEFLIVPGRGRNVLEPCEEMARVAVAAFPHCDATMVPLSLPVALGRSLSCKPTAGITAAAYYLERYDRVHIAGFDILRGAACIPRHYWGGFRPNLFEKHSPEREAVWFHKQIHAGRLILIPPVVPLDLNENQRRERAKYTELYSRPIGKRQRGYGDANHARPAYRLLRSINPQSVADVGCGSGAFCRWLRSTNETMEIHAIDWASVPNVPPCINIAQAPAWNLPLADKSVEYVTSFDMMEHLLPEDVMPTLRELARVAQRGFIFSIHETEASGRAADGSTLHPTKRPIDWWKEKIGRVATVQPWLGAPRKYIHATL